jgi:chromatin remodeling complex protein RSC6
VRIKSKKILLTNIKTMNKTATSVKATPKPRTKKETPGAKAHEPTPVEAAPVVEAPVVEAPVVEAPVVETLTFRQRLETLVKSRLESIDRLKREVQELRRLQKDHDHILKEASKKNKKKAPRDYSKPRKATGFAGPVTVSDELYAFLTKTKAVMKDPSYQPKNDEEYNNWPRIPVKSGQPIARTDVTSHISKYIKEKNLQNPESKREILPDAILRKVFTNSALAEQPTSFNYLKLQTYLNHHFIKP